MDSVYPLAALGTLMLAASVQAADLTQWSRFERGEHPDYLYESGVPSVETDVVWCSWHEGILHQGLTPNEFRNKCIEVQGSKAARDRVRNASNDQIATYLETMDQYFSRPNNGGYQMLYKQLEWVLNHEGRKAEVRLLLDQGNYNAIRSIYHDEQSHHAHVEYMVYAASDGTLQRMISSTK